MVAVLLCVAAVGTASAKTGIHVGYVNSKYYPHVGELSPENSKLYNGFEVGLDNKTKIIGNILSVKYGLNYTFLELEGQPLLSYDVKTVNHYLDIPVHLQVGIPLGIIRIYAYGGPKFLMGLSSKTTYSNAESTLSYNLYNGKVQTDGPIDDKINAQIGTSEGDLKRFDILLGAGLGVELFGMLNVTAGYDWGLLNQSKHENLEFLRNQFNVSIGILF